jgi:hypothetical protein
MAEYALMQRVSIAIWSFSLAAERVDRRLAAVLAADVALVGGGTQGECSPMFGGGRATQKQVPQTSLGPGDHLSQGLYAVGLAFVGNHDEALAYARRAFALNQEGWRFEVRVQ